MPYPIVGCEMTSLHAENKVAWHTNLFVERDRLRRISGLAVPMIAAALATNLMTVIDTLMVGQLGETALGGVGIGGQLFFLLLSGALGLAAGVQSMVARRVGQGRLGNTGEVLNAGLLLGFCIGTGLVIVGYLIAPALFAVINDDPLVVRDGLAYLATRLPALLLMSLTLPFRAYWLGINRAKWSMISIIAVSVSNAVFNYLFIFGQFGAPQLGVAGAGLGSTLAVLVGLLVNLWFAFKHTQAFGFLACLPTADSIKTILRIAFPESFRQAFFSIGVLLMYVIIGQIGTAELAAFHVIISICLIAYLPHIGIGGAATTLVGEALGRGDVPDAKRWGWQVSNLGLLVLAALGCLVAMHPQSVLAWFLIDSDALSISVLPLQLAVFAHVLDGYAKILAGALIGAGATKMAMRMTLLPQYILLLPMLAAFVVLGHGLGVAMAVFLVAVAISALLFACVWQRQRWSGIEL